MVGHIKSVIRQRIEHAVGKRGWCKRHRPAAECLNAVEDPLIAQRLVNIAVRESRIEFPRPGDKRICDTFTLFEECINGFTPCRSHRPRDPASHTCSQPRTLPRGQTFVPFRGNRELPEQALELPLFARLLSDRVSGKEIWRGFRRTLPAGKGERRPVTYPGGKSAAVIRDIVNALHCQPDFGTWSRGQPGQLMIWQPEPKSNRGFFTRQQTGSRFRIR